MTNKSFETIIIGAGPASLALAAALADKAYPPSKAVLLESRPEMSWHPGMLLPSTYLQVSFLKDLATIRLPTSSYTYLNYLYAKGGLDTFINRRRWSPSRKSYNDYLQWVASRLPYDLDFCCKCEEISPSLNVDLIDELRVRYNCNGETMQVTARNVVLSCGRPPNIPPGVIESPRVVHSSKYLTTLKLANPSRVLVVGSGQSAAEISRHLLAQGHQVTNLMRGFGYKPADDSLFINESFSSSTAALMRRLPQGLRQELLGRHADTNYNVVDSSIINDLYDQLNDHPESFTLMRLCELKSACEINQAVIATIVDRCSGNIVERHYDALVCATGYKKYDLADFIPSWPNWLEFDPSYPVLDDYSVKPKSGGARLYLQGWAEHTNGIGDVLLSDMARRGNVIADSIIANQP